MNLREQEDQMKPCQWALLALPICLAATNLTVRGTERAEIDNAYKWKPEHIYAGVAAWQADVDSLKTDVEKLTAFKGRFAGPNATDPAKALIEFNALAKEFEIKFDHVGVYVECNFNVDMGNSEWSGREQIVQNLAVDHAQKMAWYEPELLQIPQATMMKYVDEHPELQPYRKTYEDMYALQKHTLSEAEEEILALLGQHHRNQRRRLWQIHRRGHGLRNDQG